MLRICARVLCASAVFATLEACGTHQRDASRVDQFVPAPTLTDFTFLVGVWEPADESTGMTEIWTAPDRGVMRGLGVSPRGDAIGFFEFLAIEIVDGRPTYFASPRGRVPASQFPLIELAESRVVFENLSHDFPQRVIYTRVDDLLHARIEGISGGQERSAEWSWKKR